MISLSLPGYATWVLTAELTVRIGLLELVYSGKGGMRTQAALAILFRCSGEITILFIGPTYSLSVVCK